MAENQQKKWERFRQEELKKLTLVLEQLGFSLESKQVHIGGERYLTGAKKLILIGERNSDNKKVVIKAASEAKMIAEIKSERNSRSILKDINFAYNIFSFPQEILYIKKQDYLIFITEFIDQKRTFLSRPFKEQFFISLRAFELQEAIQFTTYEHANIIKKVFGMWNSQKYLTELDRHQKEINDIFTGNQNLKNILAQAESFLQEQSETIDLYCNFLTHWDFVPHNFRILKDKIYLLDHSSLRFGNKYESWARFINFMTLYNAPLEQALLDYVKDNRGVKEYTSLRLMRIFRLVELIWYYASTLENAAGDLKILNKKRIDLWTKVLSGVLADKNLDRNIFEKYKKDRNSLRSQEEKERQEKLH